MKLKSLFVLCAVVLVASCGDGDGCGASDPCPVDRVEVTPQAATSQVGQTQLFTARVIDTEGSTVAGASVSWSSNNTNVATVASDGLATGVSVGTATITASSSGKSGGATLTVEQPDASSIVISSGDQQTVRTGSTVPVAPSVVVRDASSQPIQGVTVSFAISGGGGSLTGSSATTNASGIASTGGWTLGPTPGANTLTASVAGVQPVTFTATARPPHWTVMVYMAADNNLAWAGIGDIDEMEAAGTDPEVQVVVQAEFSETQVDLGNCGSECFNRPNFNTFRYFIDGTGESVKGPDGPATDIGNRDMTSPAELNEFVRWSQATYAAEHYVLVLWNHGGGYAGLIEDATSAGPTLMPISALRPALSGVDQIDILDFDMCLMAGYETLVMVEGSADYVVFSEETVPGAGNPYREFLDGIQELAAAAPVDVARVIVERFHQSYQGNRASTTQSAYDMVGFARFETALDVLAGSLQEDLPSIGSAIRVAAEGSQKFYYRELTDIVDFLTLLKQEIADPTLRAQIDDVVSEATGSFRILNRVRDGSEVSFGAEASVMMASGLHIVMPSGVGEDILTNSGPRSFEEYAAAFMGRPWTEFLADWLAGGDEQTVLDQGNERFEGYLFWNPAAIAEGVDIDLWVLEPSGNLFIPWLGSVTPNGHLTNDSADDGTNYEGYLTNRFVEPGLYKFYAHLYADPSSYTPEFDVLFRLDQTSVFESLYTPDFPWLSLQTSWLDDPDASFAKVEAGEYTDLKWAMWLDMPSAGPNPDLQVRPVMGSPHGVDAQGIAAPSISKAQLDRVRRALSERANRVRAPTTQPSLDLRQRLLEWRGK